MTEIPPWKSAVITKRATQRSLIPPEWRLSPTALLNASLSSIETIRESGILSAQELAWTETTDIRDLVSGITKGDITSFDLTTAFCKRAAIAQQLTRCLTEICFERALKRARELDDYFVRTGEVVGPLHGIPVSIKDRFDIEGLDTTVGKESPFASFGPLLNTLIGWVGLIDKPAKSSSEVVQLLESMGAVLYVKTNVPQSLMVRGLSQLELTFLQWLGGSLCNVLT